MTLPRRAGIHYLRVEQSDLPEPEMTEQDGGFLLTIFKDILNEAYLVKLGLNERQVKAVMYVKEHSKINNKVYQLICNTSDRTATRDLANLVSSNIFKQIGTTGKGTKYILRRHIDAKDAVKRPNYL